MAKHLVHCFARWEEEGMVILPKSMGSTARKMRTMKMDDRPGFSLQESVSFSVRESHVSASISTDLTSYKHNVDLRSRYYLSASLMSDLTSSREKRWCCDSRGTRPSNGIGKVQGKDKLISASKGKKDAFPVVFARGVDVDIVVLVAARASRVEKQDAIDTAIVGTLSYCRNYDRSEKGHLD
ncbi:hypothetical protein RHMOL_Rhmol12G0222300 [Rhododendron molle]|uniref:Uncharacterized protein n=2 Tax=Rhododendron molle TaxID=49168 RepID=A0ACC0LM11_RHOML|nr:hypothetical protein RHMOL_Rhmol12G0222300 [Rhododendron molle]KAI8529402.1 hypothetical protein RHMOL_Rhmol12G0222300 [Rhododendron molle]